MVLLNLWWPRGAAVQIQSAIMSAQSKTNGLSLFYLYSIYTLSCFIYTLSCSQTADGEKKAAEHFHTLSGHLIQTKRCPAVHIPLSSPGIWQQPGFQYRFAWNLSDIFEVFPPLTLCHSNILAGLSPLQHWRSLSLNCHWLWRGLFSPSDPCLRVFHYVQCNTCHSVWKTLSLISSWRSWCTALVLWFFKSNNHFWEFFPNWCVSIWCIFYS